MATNAAAMPKRRRSQTLLDRSHGHMDMEGEDSLRFRRVRLTPISPPSHPPSTLYDAGGARGSLYRSRCAVGGAGGQVHDARDGICRSAGGGGGSAAGAPTLWRVGPNASSASRACSARGERERILE